MMIFDDHQVKNVLLVKTIHTYTKRFLLAIGKKKFFSLQIFCKQRKLNSNVNMNEMRIILE